MSLFDEQPPLIDSKVLRQWLKSNYSIFNIKDIKIDHLACCEISNFCLHL